MRSEWNMNQQTIFEILEHVLLYSVPGKAYVGPTQIVFILICLFNSKR